ncbi:MAG: DNA polymerase/3'-5' exonuclease PolX [Candidatus Omnitrophica bacterium]|nr:DNA polymerase/3'-5' exonuclease PolX [Candidatus Omnitrophota bacterium]
MKNLEMARIFNEIADMLELQDENLFRIRAYRRAALNLESLGEDLEEVVRRDELRKIPGIGADLALKIKTFFETGRVDFYEKIKKKTPAVLLEMITIPGMGPKTAKLLYSKLKIRSIPDLEKKARAHKISGLPGIKDKTEENIIKGIEFIKKKKGRMLLSTAAYAANEVLERLKRLKEVKKISPAGSLRRQKETVRDIDILVISTKPAKVMKTFTALPQVKEVLAHGPTKSGILTKDDIQVDVRVMEKGSFGAALVYFTGSKAHNIRLRKLAIEKGLKVNEYGVFKGKREKRIAGKTEGEVYESLGLVYIPPELREDQGEIEAALEKRLPKLLELKDIKGDLHVHSDWSDGRYSIEGMAEAARKRGYEYIAITDHSKGLKIAGGLSNKERLKQIDEIHRINRRLKGIKVLAGAEVDIRDNGSLDYSDDILKKLDVVIAAVHSGFKQPGEKLTKRIVTAMKNRYVDIIAHPTGRLMGTRDAYQIDTEEVLKVAKDTDTAIEINAYPERLDLNDIGCRRAKELGVLLAISTDAHITEQFDNMRYGVGVARRGWLERRDVLNTLSWDKVRERLKAK